MLLASDSIGFGLDGSKRYTNHATTYTVAGRLIAGSEVASLPDMLLDSYRGKKVLTA